MVWIDGGIHAREWASIHTALYFIDKVCPSIFFSVQLVIGYQNKDAQLVNYLDTLNFYITPVLNPDGFEFSRSATSPKV